MADELALHTTSIDGLVLVDLVTFPDDRGSFTEAWQTEKMQALGLPDIRPKQISVSKSRKGVVRGIHAEPWDKFINVVVGEVFAPITDLRPDSPTFGQVETFTLNASVSLFLPKGMGNAFQALTDEVVYVYAVTGLFDIELSKAGKYPAVHFEDPDLGIDWPITGDAQIVSEKDRNNPTLRQAFPDRF